MSGVGASALYRGWVRHRRYRPVEHSFRYPLYLLYLDLDELDHVFEGSSLFAANRPAAASFRREDHVGDPGEPLGKTVRDLVADRIGRRPSGPIRLLTQLRILGYCFNPVSFYYLYDDEGSGRLEAIVAEVDNTPWGERHCYVLPAESSMVKEGDAGLRFRFAKAFHVSPFLPMDLEYDWRLTVPGRRLVVHMNDLESEQVVFDATMVLRREAISPASLRRAFFHFPWMSLRVLIAIYWQAARLKLRGATFHPHPGSRSGRSVSGPAMATQDDPSSAAKGAASDESDAA